VRGRDLVGVRGAVAGDVRATVCCSGLYGFFECGGPEMAPALPQWRTAVGVRGPVLPQWRTAVGVRGPVLPQWRTAVGVRGPVLPQWRTAVGVRGPVLPHRRTARRVSLGAGRVWGPRRRSVGEGSVGVDRAGGGGGGGSVAGGAAAAGARVAAGGRSRADAGARGRVVRGGGGPRVVVPLVHRYRQPRAERGPHARVSRRGRAALRARVRGRRLLRRVSVDPRRRGDGGRARAAARVARSGRDRLDRARPLGDGRARPLHALAVQ